MLISALKDRRAVNDKITIYPNPTTSYLNIKSDNLVNSLYQLISLEGKVLSSGIIDSDNYQMDLSHLAAGFYFLRINNNTYNIIVISA